MPAASEILASLELIANQASAIAVGWHVALAFVFVALALGFRLSQRLAAQY